VRVGGVFKLGGGNSVSCRMLMLVCESNGVYVGARIKRCVIASVASPVCMRERGGREKGGGQREREGERANERESEREPSVYGYVALYG
jgi:hypothetical protein